MRIFLAFVLAGCLQGQPLVADRASIELARGASAEVAFTMGGRSVSVAELDAASDDDSVASVATFAGALRIDSIGEGTTVIRVGDQGELVDIPTHVSPPAIVAVSITPAMVSVPVEDSVAIAATASDTTGAVLDVSSEATWQVMDPSIAAIDPNAAELRATTPGTTALAASYGGVQVTVPVVVY